MLEEACCTCAALLSEIPPQYDLESEKPMAQDRRLDCCGRVICAKCITVRQEYTPSVSVALTKNRCTIGESTVCDLLSAFLGFHLSCGHTDTSQVHSVKYPALHHRCHQVYETLPLIRHHHLLAQPTLRSLRHQMISHQHIHL